MACAAGLWFWLASTRSNGPIIPQAGGKSATTNDQTPAPGARPPKAPPEANAAGRVDPALAAALIRQAFRSSPSTEAELIATLRDPKADLRSRCEAARQLARSATGEAQAAITEALSTGPPILRAAIAEGLGGSPLPGARETLAKLLNDADEVVARGAVRGWAGAGDTQAVSVLSETVYNGDKPESVRTEAALALGDLPGQPEAFITLTNAAWQLRDDALAPAVLEGLGRRSIGETHSFFRDYLSKPDIPAELRSAAVEALGQAEGDSTPMLLEYVRDDDPSVRASAAWAMSRTTETGRAGEALIAQLNSETDPTVRLRLYQALGNQEGFDPAAVIPLLQQETRPEVRLSGLDFLGQACLESPAGPVREFFDSVAVPELRAAALGSGDQHARMTAVIALQRAETPAASAALREIAFQSPDPKIAEAARAGNP